jgi:ribosomal protein S6
MALRYYEGMWLFDSSEAAKDMPATIAHVDGILKKHGAQILKLERWDDRKLAYDIGNVKRGTYVLGMFQAEPTAIPGIHRDGELSELIMRQMFLEDEDLLAKVKEREELKKKREAEAAQAAAEGLPIEGDRDRGRYGDRPRFARDRDRDRDGDRGGPRRERPAPVAAEDIEVPEELNQ